MPSIGVKHSFALAHSPGATDLATGPLATSVARPVPRASGFVRSPRRAELLTLAMLVGCGDNSRPSPAPPTGAPTSTPSTTQPRTVESVNDYVPNEFKAGMSRWKDTGVYLDGKPIGFVQFGELPITLKPTWIKDKVSVDKPPDCPIEQCPGWKWSKHRSYNFVEYLKAIGVDIRSVKMMHVYGPKLSDSIAVTGADLTSKAASEFWFRFGGLVSGKAIPHVPPSFGNGRSPDKMSGVMIYVKKKPPTITRDGVELDGVPQTGVPYYGEPVRGGVRVYLDDRLVAIIKRQELDVARAQKAQDGELHWSFKEFLADHSVDTSNVQEGWIIRDDRRTEVIAWDQLGAMRFSAGTQARGGVLLGDAGLRANAIALHSRRIARSELPVIEPDEE